MYYIGGLVEVGIRFIGYERGLQGFGSFQYISISRSCICGKDQLKVSLRFIYRVYIVYIRDREKIIKKGNRVRRNTGREGVIEVKWGIFWNVKCYGIKYQRKVEQNLENV